MPSVLAVYRSITYQAAAAIKRILGPVRVLVCMAAEMGRQLPDSMMDARDHLEVTNRPRRWRCHWYAFRNVLLVKDVQIVYRGYGEAVHLADTLLT